MLQRSPLLLVVISFVLLSFAKLSIASGTELPGQVFYNSNGMPVCLQASGVKSGSLLFFWEDRLAYKRDVKVASMRDIRRKATTSLPALDSCNRAQDFIDSAKSQLAWLQQWPTIRLKEGRAVYADSTFPISARDVELFQQIEHGSQVAHESSAKEYLAKHPISAFTREVNQKLTLKLGVGFVADIYKEFVESQPQNIAFGSIIRDQIEQAEMQKDQADQTQLDSLKKYRLVVVQGFMQTTGHSRLEPLLQMLASFGLDLQVLATDPVGTTLSNAPVIARQLRLQMRNSEKPLILMSASKGVPELLAALSQIAPTEPGYEKIKAVVALSGMLDGSFLVDWAQGFPQRLFVKSILEDAAKKSGLELKSTDGFESMSTASIRSLTAGMVSGLPRTIRYFNLIGVIGGYGLAEDPEIRELQEKLAIHNAPPHGANDGYIEYPGTVVPGDWGLNTVDVVFSGSHAVLDGKLGALDLKDASQRKTAVRGVFGAIAQEIR